MEAKTTILRLHEVDSTNRYLRDYPLAQDEEMAFAVADYQTAGRGCGANTWESEPGKNLLFSLVVSPSWVPVERQFVLSMAEALAVKAAINEWVADGVTLKWPNDIYHGDRKLSGTLIELSVGKAAIRRCIIGTGVNVNQQCFVSDAPNPVSLCQILGHETDPERLFRRIVHHFQGYWQLLKQGAYAEISRRYHASLYRFSPSALRSYPFSDREGRFMGRILRVEPDGRLVVEGRGTVREYGFKELAFIQEK